MRYLDKYKIFESTKSIDLICKEYGIKNYTINTDGTIDVNGSVDLSYKRLSKLPIKFGHVTGSFWCDNNQLTTLEGCPKSVGLNFWCHKNRLTTLEGCPSTVGQDFSCSYNQLTTLEGLTDVSIGGRFLYEDNPIYKVTKGWLINEDYPDMDRIELFNDIGIVVGNKLYLPKLEYFHEEIGFPLPKVNKVKKDYKIIE